MKLEDYTNLVTKIVTSDTEREETGQTLLEALKADDLARTEAEEKSRAQEEKIKKLSEANSRLFLQVTGQSVPDAGQEKTPEEDFTELFNKRFYPKGE